MRQIVLSCIQFVLSFIERCFSWVNPSKRPPAPHMEARARRQLGPIPVQQLPVAISVQPIHAPTPVSQVLDASVVTDVFALTRDAMLHGHVEQQRFLRQMITEKTAEVIHLHWLIVTQLADCILFDLAKAISLMREKGKKFGPVGWVRRSRSQVEQELESIAQQAFNLASKQLTTIASWKSLMCDLTRQMNKNTFAKLDGSFFGDPNEFLCMSNAARQASGAVRQIVQHCEEIHGVQGECFLSATLPDPVFVAMASHGTAALFNQTQKLLLQS